MRDYTICGMRSVIAVNNKVATLELAANGMNCSDAQPFAQVLVVDVTIEVQIKFCAVVCCICRGVDQNNVCEIARFIPIEVAFPHARHQCLS